MPEVATSTLTSLQSCTARVRNVCVVAHVDHGKTTLTDGLIASNGIIHPRLAGSLRYLDTREDEQQRCITMKASSISLLHEGGDGRHLVNLIDSPGHVDFCSEVSAAVRLSDGAIVVVDALEGVCIQTRATLRQAWDEGLGMTLVLNKVDRLISELCLTPEEAYQRLRRVVADVNLLIGTFRSEEYISRADELAMDAEAAREAREGEEADAEDVSISIEDASAELEALLDDDDDEDMFSPERGNVAFASAYDGWAFTIDQFADMYAAKMGASRRALLKGLWGDRYYHPKTRRIVGRKLAGNKLKPMFAQLCLEPIWRVYSTAAEDDAQAGRPLLTALASKMKLSVPARELSKAETASAVRSVMRAWLPLAKAVLSNVAHALPSPADAAATRAPHLLGASGAARKRNELPSRPDEAEETAACSRAIAQCSSDESAPVVAYVAKMVSVELADLPPQSAAAAAARAEAAAAEIDSGDAPPQIFVAVARVFSGVLTAATSLYVLNAAHDPSDAACVEAAAARVLPPGSVELFLPMGRALEPVESVPAGNLVAIAGLSSRILKSATLASTPLSRALAPMSFPAAPIVRVAVEPSCATDLPQLEAGLRLLNQADPFVDVVQEPTGELVVGAAGEVHLERCVKDLQERFARVPVRVSAPLIAFRESLASAEEQRPPPQPSALPAYWRGAAVPADGTRVGAGMKWAAEVSLGGGAHAAVARLRVRCARIPLTLAKAIDESRDELAAALGGAEGGAGVDADVGAIAATVTEQAPGSGPASAGDDREHDAPIVAEAARAVHDRLLAAAGQVSEQAADGAWGAEAPDTMGLQPAELLARMWSLGPHNTGACMLLAAGRDGGRCARDAALRATAADAIAGGDVDALSERWIPLGHPVASRRLRLVDGDCDGEAQAEAKGDPGLVAAVDQLGTQLATLEAGVLAGFQAAAQAGPLCNEPMWAVAFEVEACLDTSASRDAAEGTGGDGKASVGGAAGGAGGANLSALSGQALSATKEALRAAMLASGPRLVEAMYICECGARTDALGGAYASISRRRGRVLREEVRIAPRP